MQSRRSLLLSLVCVTIIAGGAPVLAQSAQQNGRRLQNRSNAGAASGNPSETDTQRTIPDPTASPTL